MTRQEAYRCLQEEVEAAVDRYERRTKAMLSAGGSMEPITHNEEDDNPDDDVLFLCPSVWTHYPEWTETTTGENTGNAK